MNKEIEEKVDLYEWKRVKYDQEEVDLFIKSLKTEDFKNTKLKSEKQEKIKGVFYGLVWGDVFGCPVEGWKKGQIENIYGNYKLPKEYPFKKIITSKKKDNVLPMLNKLRPIGLHSDDTQISMALTNCCLSLKKNEDFQENWKKWLTECFKRDQETGVETWRDYGTNFKTSVEKMIKSSPYESGGPSSGIGGAIRVAPIAILYHDKPEILELFSWNQCLMTNSSMESGSLSFAVAKTISMILNDESISNIIQNLAITVRESEKQWKKSDQYKINIEHPHAISYCLDNIFNYMKDYLGDEIEEIDYESYFYGLQQLISKQAREFLKSGHNKSHPNQGASVLGGVHAIAMGLCPDIKGYYKGSFPVFVLTTLASLGYDTDSVCSICGAILGARFGSTWIPVNNILDIQRVDKYVSSILDGKAPETLEVFVEHEKNLSLHSIIFKHQTLDKYVPRDLKRVDFHHLEKE